MSIDNEATIASGIGTEESPTTTAATTTTDNKHTQTVNIVKSSSDDRKYSYFTLSNKLKVLLIQDETCDKAAAAMDVAVGQLQDPKEVQGLAHFLEHMLFLGMLCYECM